MIKSISFAALVLFSLPPALAAPPRMDTMAISRSDARLTIGCTPDRLCVELTPSQPGCEEQACATDLPNGANLNLKLSGSQRDLPHTTYRLSGLSSEVQLWPQVIRFEGGILAGVETQVSAIYSGGGAGSTALHLIAFLPGRPPFAVLSVPQSAEMMIRACFSERDMKQRAGACHDQYTFNASLALTETSAAGMPVLRYRSEATSFPGPVSRSKDSLAARRLRERDIVTVTDPQCTYQRLYRFNPDAGGYVPDKPPPDCSNYTVP